MVSIKIRSVFIQSDFRSFYKPKNKTLKVLDSFLVSLILFIDICRYLDELFNFPNQDIGTFLR